MLFDQLRGRTRISGSLLARSETYWVAELSREDIVEVARGGPANPVRVPASQIPRMDAGPDGALAVWRAVSKGELGCLPQVIIADQGVLEDFTAWAATYFPSLGPLSAQTRLLTPTVLREARRRESATNWRRLAACAVALCFGEVLSYTDQSRRATDITFIMCRSTLSFTLIRSAILGFQPSRIKEIAQSWRSVRSRLGQSTNVESSQLVQEIIFDLAKKAEVGTTAKGRALLGYDLDVPSILGRYGVYGVGNEGPLFSSRQKHERSLTAEERVEIFDRVSTALVHEGGRGDLEKGLILATLAYWCRAGFPQQLAIMAPYQEVFPQSTIWLAALQQESAKSDALAIGEGIGWRLARELFRAGDVFATPSCDISELELEVLMRGSNFKGLTTASDRARLEVELFPGVTTVVRTEHYSVQSPGEVPITGNTLHSAFEEKERERALKSVESSLQRAVKDIQRLRRQKRR